MPLRAPEVAVPWHVAYSSRQRYATAVAATVEAFHASRERLTFGAMEILTRKGKLTYTDTASDPAQA